MTVWEIEIRPAEGECDALGVRITQDAQQLGLLRSPSVRTARAFLLDGGLTAEQARVAAEQLLADPVVERYSMTVLGDDRGQQPHPPAHPLLVQVLYHPGVMDPVAESTLAILQEMGLPVQRVATVRKYWFAGEDQAALPLLCQKLLANDSIERFVLGPLPMRHLEIGAPYSFQLVAVPLRNLDDAALMRLSREGQLSLSLAEMKAIQSRYSERGREPTDIELETIAQTWSEHCSHKTLAGPIHYEDEHGRREFRNLLKETIFAATQTIRERLRDADWCVSVFEDNAGVVRFTDRYHVTFKVETHNHPSAMEPYGGANTGVGGVIRDTLGTGLGAQPIANTDILCFAPPDLPASELPEGVLHPLRIMTGVVAGIRDYGNRMGVPTVNGAIFFDPRYLGNPLVYCGNIGLLPVDRVRKQPLPGDWIVSVGGRTGRDGIHGATFSSTLLSSESETVSGGAVQIGNAITEKMLTDVLIAARDRGLYHAITDCGAGGYSSAVGEMAAELGATVWLEKVPLKYQGLSYTEIWISESQERMVVAVPPVHWDEFHELCTAEDVTATVIGRFEATKELRLCYDGHEVGRLSMKFLHDGRPRTVRQARYQPAATGWEPRAAGESSRDQAAAAHLLQSTDWTKQLKEILATWNCASKEWVLRQYDHEVQGHCVLKPLVGAKNDGPGDAAVVQPVAGSCRGLAISAGLNPWLGDLDSDAMAASAIDEAVRNCVAVGADPSRIAILDNFSWGNCDQPETLGSLVRAALACRRVAECLGTPFISGKDSLNNEFHFENAGGPPRKIAIPGTLLISALGLVPDVRRCVTMDLKQPGNALYLVGLTKAELGGSHVGAVAGLTGLGPAPTIDESLAPAIFARVHRAIRDGLVRACHDLSEGGLAVALAEMAFAGGWGAEIDIQAMPTSLSLPQRLPWVLLFSESNTRFLCEVEPDRQSAWESVMAGLPFAYLGRVTDTPRVVIRSPDRSSPSNIIDASLDELKAAWQEPFKSLLR